MAIVQLAVAVGALLAIGVLIFGGNFIAELADGEPADEAWLDTRELMVGVIGAVGGLVAAGIVNVAELSGMAADLLGTSPIALTNLFSIGLGWLGITGRLELGPKLFVGASLGFLGLSLLITEARKNGA